MKDRLINNILLALKKNNCQITDILKIESSMEYLNQVSKTTKVDMFYEIFGLPVCINALITHGIVLYISTEVEYLEITVTEENNIT